MLRKGRQFLLHNSTRHVNLVTNPVISREWGKDQEVFTTSEAYPWWFVTQIFRNSQPSHGGNRKIFEVMTSTLSRGTLCSIASLLAVVLYQENPDRNNKLWNISERANFRVVFKTTFWWGKGVYYFFLWSFSFSRT